MKCFTPELYVQGQSREDEVLDRAHEEWERANQRYLKQYRRIERELPAALRRFHDEQCLHDAEWCGMAPWPVTMPASDAQCVAIIVRQDNTLIPQFLNTLAVLQYVITAPPVIERPVEDFFRDVRPVWLYEEVDLIGPGVFSHSILLSNGLVVTIQFREFSYHIAPLLDPGPKQLAKARRAAMGHGRTSA